MDNNTHGEHEIGEGMHITSDTKPESITPEFNCKDSTTAQTMNVEKESSKTCESGESNDGISTAGSTNYKSQPENARISNIPDDTDDDSEGRNNLIITLLTILTALTLLASLAAFSKTIVIERRQNVNSSIQETVNTILSKLEADYLFHEGNDGIEYEKYVEEIDSLSKQIDSLEQRIEVLEQASKETENTGVWVEEKEHGWLGIIIADGSIEGNVDIVKGVGIVEVAPGSPADRAGLKKGTLITEINGVEINNCQALKKEMDNIAPGETTVVTTTSIDDKGNYVKTLYSVKAASKQSVDWDSVNPDNAIQDK